MNLCFKLRSSRDPTYCHSTEKPTYPSFKKYILLIVNLLLENFILDMFKIINDLYSWWTLLLERSRKQKYIKGNVIFTEVRKLTRNVVTVISQNKEYFYTKVLGSDIRSSGRLVSFSGNSLELVKSEGVTNYENYLRSSKSYFAGHKIHYPNV